METAHNGKFVILRMGSDATVCSDASHVRDSLNGLLTRNEKHVCVDLSRAVVIDSCVIGALVEFHTRLCDKGGELVILNAKNIVLEALLRTQINQVIRFVESEAQLR